MENPIKMDDLGIPLFLEKTQLDNWGEMTLLMEVLAPHFFTDDVSAHLVGDDEDSGIRILGK